MPASTLLTPFCVGPRYLWIMKDLLFVVLTFVFFVLSWLYVRACERL